jgi:hypothetical protein
MAKPDLTPVNLGSIARGAGMELFEKALHQVVQNIADTDCAAEDARTITLTFKFKPESDRRKAHVTTSAKTTLAGAENHTSAAFIGKDTEGQYLMFLEDPRQDVLFEAPKQAENLLNFKAGEQG